MAYSTFQVLEQAIEGAGTTDREAVSQYIKDNSFDTVIGALEFDEFNNNPDCWTVGQWQDGVFKVVGPPIAGIIGALLAALDGIATLELSGVYFVIFTLGLAELVRQIITWVQSMTGQKGLYVLTDTIEASIYWQLVGLAALVYLGGWLIGRSCLGFALRIIGDDEVVARHSGINTSLAKVRLFMVPGAVTAITGAVLAPRYVYIEPSRAFTPMLSFQVVIVALLGGTGRLWGPIADPVHAVVGGDLVIVPRPDDAAACHLLPDHRLLPAQGLRRAAEAGPGLDPVAGGLRRSTGPTVLSLRGATKLFGGLVAVNELSFDISKHQVMGLIGPNGSGTSTTLNLISGASDRPLAPSRSAARRSRACRRGRSAAGRRTHVPARPATAVDDRARERHGRRGLRPPPPMGRRGRGARDGHARHGRHRAPRGGAFGWTYIDTKRVELARVLASDPRFSSSTNGSPG